LPSIADITLWLALWAGVLSFVSPCTLPLYPAYLSYITGISVPDLKQRKSTEIRWKLVSHTLFFIGGISSVYFVLAYGASFFGQFFMEHRLLIQKISGIFIIVLGLFLLGIFKISWLTKERRIFNITKKPVGYTGSAFIGVGFAAGWIPCIGPILTVILAFAATNPTQAMGYMSAYVLGFALPFVGLSFFIGSTGWILKYSNLIMKTGAVVMIMMGILLYTDLFTTINLYIYQWIQGTWFSRLG
jgi:cytochrome c-type biogenesis protein